MIDFLELTNEVGPYMLLMSMLFTAAAVYAFGYLFQNGFKLNQVVKQERNADLQCGNPVFDICRSIDSIQSWITKKMKRKDSPDDNPAHSLLVFDHNGKMKKQGGLRWKRKSAALHSRRVQFYLLSLRQQFC
ncbi:hypothetical protein GJU40_05485 [Bacillus lacus]|uniref:Uncharacterized protein n=1 Tax=Metabacillus lacus TaxID=1983721 RepID=A0A7X2IXH2_9BACI|nr:hypothetical protein [Metabacillus lacus]MRX71627.1 hypothetical protein [Metabacillus lacus]